MPAPSYKPVILYQQIRRDGSCNVKIRITHKRKSKYIPTSITASKGDYDKEYQLKNSVILRLSDLLKSIGSVLESKTVFEWDMMDIDEVYSYLSAKMRPSEKFQLDFFEWGEQFLKGKSEGTRSNYKCALSAFEQFLDTRVFDISGVTSSLMRRFENYLIDKHGKDARAVSLYTSSISTIHAEARRTYNDNELGDVLIRNPFEFYTPPKQKPTLKRTIEFDVIQRLIDIREHLGEYHKLAVDIYLLSFCLMGTNIPDLYDAERKDDVILYNRTKTRSRRFDKAAMQIRLEPICNPIISDLLDVDNKKAFIFYKKYNNYKSIADKANDRLKEVAKVMGVEPFTMYSARHTWASIAYSIGIPKSLINDCLCHVDPDMAVTDIYIKKDWSVMWEANLKVLEQFDWK
jgi:integrase